MEDKFAVENWSMVFLQKTHMQKWRPANRKRETYQIESRTYMLFMSELDNERKIVKKQLVD